MPERYEAAEELYSTLDRLNDTPYIDRLESCRSMASFSRNEITGLVRVFTRTCKLRWCPLCASARRNWLQGEISHWLNLRGNTKFITLTLKHTDDPLRVQFGRLYQCFINLRRRGLFTRKVDGGVWFFQITKHSESGQWHPHLHCLLDADFILHKTLSSVWRSITGDSMVVDIRSVHNLDKAADYVARYATSPGELKKLVHNDRLELHEVLHGRRICGTWGTGRTIRLRPPVADDLDKWHHVGSWLVVSQAEKSHVAASMILKAWQTQTVLPAGVNMQEEEDFIEGRIREVAKYGLKQFSFDFYHT